MMIYTNFDQVQNKLKCSICFFGHVSQQRMGGSAMCGDSLDCHDWEVAATVWWVGAGVCQLPSSAQASLHSSYPVSNVSGAQVEKFQIWVILLRLYSCLESPMNRGAWQATVCKVTESRTQLKWLSTLRLYAKEQGWRRREDGCRQEEQCLLPLGSGIMGFHGCRPGRCAM